ncbi:MAG: hypothetical protein CVV02_11960 [Firmicutes bacterium HGW-Firmicutes-7]|nr:MAG: hypothetical protein CVV02_11960 [Firmicutes bacterium HGW-Firmicutes-7]
MPWCPKCKSEYEKGVLSCVECKVELVDDLAKHVNYVSLVKLDASIVKGVVEYLAYSGVNDYQLNQEEQTCEVLVNEKDVKKASKHLNVYLYNLQKEAMEQEDLNESEELIPKVQDERLDDVYSNESKLKEMRSSATTFFVFGGAILLFDLLNIVNILKVVSGLSEGIMLIIGVGFIVLGIITLKKIPSIEEKVNAISDNVGEMVSWYENTNNMDQFYENKKIDITEHDEGALYFVALEEIKEGLIKQFPEQKEAFINLAADEIYSKIK